MNDNERPLKIEDKENIYHGKIFLITGAASGIGKGIAEAAIQRSAEVIGLDKNVVQVSGLRATHEVNITSRENLEQISRAIERSNKKIDFLFLSAGIIQSQPGAISEGEKTNIHNVNAQGTISSFETFKPLLKDGATVVFLSSDLINDPNTSVPVYAESKRKIAEFAQRQAEALGNIRIITLFPGPVDTPLFRHGKNEETLRRINTAVGIMTPEEFASELLDNILPNPIDYLSGSKIRMYKGKTETVS